MPTTLTQIEQCAQALRTGKDMKGLCAGFKLVHGTMETRYALLKDGTVLVASATDAHGPHRNDFDFPGQSWTRTDVSVLEQADFIGWYKAPWFV